MARGAIYGDRFLRFDECPNKHKASTQLRRRGNLRSVQLFYGRSVDGMIDVSALMIVKKGEIVIRDMICGFVRDIDPTDQISVLKQSLNKLLGEMIEVKSTCDSRAKMI